uniref:Uncharacterized protein n=1 Tax=Desulfobacca acetoxidans TaxID=60893 RepID=A0A7C3V3G8_9BACT
MSENRQNRICWRQCWATLGTIWLIFQAVPPAWGNPPPRGESWPQGRPSPVVVLSGEFFQAMEKLGNSNAVTGDRQELLLEQIATAQRFVVKTNLSLLEQNEKIIHLLEDIRNQGRKESR